MVQVEGKENSEILKVVPIDKQRIAWPLIQEKLKGRRLGIKLQL